MHSWSSVLALALVLGLSGCRQDAPAPRAMPAAEAPNVLLITVDTLRADRLGTYGYPHATSPHIDALARESVVFERAIAAASTTAPAHASIMTSKYVREHTVGWMNGVTRLGHQETVAEVFRDAGWATAGFVGNFMLTRRLGFDRGFDRYDDDLPTPEPNRGRFYERIAEHTADRALAWLAAHEASGEEAARPVFLWVHLQDPHGPYSPPAGFADRIRIPPEADEEPLRVLQTDFALGGIPPYQRIDGLSRLSEYATRYANEIVYADYWIGRLLEAVEGLHADQPLRGTVVLLTADHGEAFGEGYRYFAHGHTTTPEVAHVPMILKAPGLSPGRNREIVHHVDVKPTLLELAGLTSPFTQSGLPLARHHRSNEKLPDRIVYCDIGRELSAYTGGGFVRVKGTGFAWAVRESGTSDPAMAWQSFQWREDGSFERGASNAFERKEEIRTYSRFAVQMAEAPPVVVDDVEHLRDLGYVIAE